jgi:hypothetical protein
MAIHHGLDPYHGVVAELGPGDSLGIGLAALLSGAEKYLAFDVVEYANIERNLDVFDELTTLFQNRIDIPGDDEFPMVKPYLDTYAFPRNIFTDIRLSNALNRIRVNKIRESIINPCRKESLIEYRVPWFGSNVIQKESVDMIYSQAVLEHVDDLFNVYNAMRLWLKPNGLISHQIDYKSHGTSEEWNGHWSYSDFMWKLIRGKRPYFLNRQPHSTHTGLLKENKFKVLCEIKAKSSSKINRDDLAKRFNSISNEDLTTSGAFIQAVKQ